MIVKLVSRERAPIYTMGNSSPVAFAKTIGPLITYHSKNKTELFEDPECQKVLLGGNPLYKCSTHKIYVVFNDTYGSRRYYCPLAVKEHCLLERAPTD